MGLSINEKLGVPSGLKELSYKLYNNIIEKLSSFNYESVDGDPRKYIYPTKEHTFSYKISDVNSKINEFLIKDVNISIIAHEVKNDKKSSTVTGAFFKPNHNIDSNNFKIKYENKSLVNIGISLDFRVTPDEFGDDILPRVKELLTNNKNSIVSSMAHELMHSYDLSDIKGSVDFSDNADYASVQNIRFGIKAIDKFLYYLYFISYTECVVKPSEVYLQMDELGVTKEGFVDFLKSNRVFNTLKDVSKWTQKSFDKELLDDIENIKFVLNESGIGIDGLSDESIIDELKSLLLNNIINSNVTIVKHLLAADDRLAFLNDSDIVLKQRFYDNHLDKLKKDAKNVDYYFDSKEKMFRLVSNKIIKKLYKLFDMAKDTNKSDLHTKINKKAHKNESILNWDAFQYANGIKRNISKKKYL